MPLILAVVAAEACSSGNTSRKVIPAQPDGSADAAVGTLDGDGGGTLDAAVDVQPPPCMDMASGATATQGPEPAVELELALQLAFVTGGAKPYLLATNNGAPIETVDGVTVPGSGATSVGVFAELSPDTLHVVSAIPLSATMANIQSVTATSAGAWVVFAASGPVDFGGVVPAGASTTTNDPMIAYVSGGTVRFVRRLGSEFDRIALSVDPSGNAWLALAAGLDKTQASFEGTAYDSNVIVTRLSPQGEYGGTRGATVGRLDSPAIAADELGGAYISAFPVSPEQDFGDGPFTIDGSTGGSVVAKFDSAGRFAWRTALIRAYADELIAIPGGFFGAGNMPQESDRNGYIDLAGTAYLPCAMQNHLTRFNAVGEPTWSRAYSDTTVRFLATNAAGDLLYERQQGGQPLVPGMTPGAEPVAFGVVSGADGAVLWERSGFRPSGVGATPSGGWIVAGGKQTILDGGLSRFSVTLAVYE